VHCSASGQVRQLAANLATPVPSLPRPIVTVTPAGQVTVSSSRSMTNPVLGEHAVLGRGWLGLALGLDVGVMKARLDLTGPIGGVTVDAGSLVIALLGVADRWVFGPHAVIVGSARAI